MTARDEQPGVTPVHVRDPDPLLADHLLVDEVKLDRFGLARLLDRATAGCDQEDREERRSLEHPIQGYTPLAPCLSRYGRRAVTRSRTRVARRARPSADRASA